MTATADSLAFATIVRQFFCGRLVAQQNAVALAGPWRRTGIRSGLPAAELLRQNAGAGPRRPSVVTDLDAPVILAFLDHLGAGAAWCVRTRNACDRRPCARS